MAENQYNSKIVLSSGEVLMDLTQDTVVADKLLKGFTAHGKDGAPITGSCEFDADTGDATAGAAEILTGKTAYVTGSKVTGTMPNNGAKTLSITEKGKPVTIPQGYHDGSGKAQIDAAEEAKLIPANIREGITVLGVLGTMGDTGRRIAVLGSMLELGDYTEEGHRRAGRAAAEHADVLYAYGPSADAIARGAEEKGMQAVHAFTDQNELVEKLRADAKPGDALLFKGSRGMRMERALALFLGEEVE